MSADVVRVPLLDAKLEARPEIGHVRSARIELTPAQETGPHRHPCDVVGYIAAGTIRFQVEGEGDRTLRAGDAFHEPAGAPIAHFDNASKDETATFIAFYLLPPGEDTLIEMLPSG
jgi:quercetin dioxygenase-like cupin family protein